jgi:amino acid transporter
MRGTQSAGASLLLWFLGTIYCLSGTHCYLEYGLNIPRYTIEGVEQSVPRSGGDLNYLQYVYRKPAYRKNTVLMSTCIFAIAFIIFGNMAGNSISFATRVLYAADIKDPSDGAVRGIAIGIAILTCFIHAFSRRFGILLNNVLAVLKVCILLLIIVTAIVVALGGLEHTANVISDNTASDQSFKGASDDVNGYAFSFLTIMFSFSGFEQPNYVLGEIAQPRRKLPVGSIVGVSTIAVLYMAVNIAYVS